MSNIKRINHVAIAVDDLDTALGFWRDTLGLDLTHVEEVKGQQSLVAFLPTGDSEIELVKPTAEDTGLARFIQNRGAGFHHLCLEVDNLETMLSRLKNMNIRLINEEPAVGAGGARMAFIHPSSAFGVLVELYETRLPTKPLPPILDSERVQLKPFELSNTQPVFNIYAREEGFQNLKPAQISYSDPLMTEATHQKEARDQVTGVRWSVVLKENSQVIGSCGYYHPRQNFPVVELGFELHPDFWSKGYMVESLTQILDYVFSDKCSSFIHRAEVLTTLGNHRSIRLVEKLGFRKEAVLKEYGYWNGTYHDLYLYALLHREWTPTK